MCSDYARFDTSIDPEILTYQKWAADKSNFVANPLAGFVFNNGADIDLKTAYAAYTTVQQDYYSYFMLGSYGNQLPASVDDMLAEFQGKVANDKEIIRQAIKQQIQDFLDAKNG